MAAGSQTCKHPQARPREFGFQARLEIWQCTIHFFISDAL